MSRHQQLLNFADKELMTSIASSSITVDGYEVENLLNRKRGFRQQNSFMCEYYMKCPVEIIISFPCLVDISHIIIEPKVSSHRSKEIEIYTLFQTPLMPDTSKNVKKEISDKKHLDNTLYPCKFPKDFRDANIRKTHQYLFNFAGKYNEPIGLDQTADRITFTNPLNSMSHDSSNDGLLVNLNSAPSTRCCSHMMFKIKWATVPVLRSLQVWGTLSTRNPRFIVGELDKLLKSINIKKSMDNKIEEPTKRLNEGIDKMNKASEKQIENIDTKQLLDDNIPKEFIDPLTFSIMTVPMMLPSGNTIDKVTLEKYIAEEEKYGRLPSDPFTGIVFQGSKVPIPNSSLKARVDDYLLKNPIHIGTSGATTGYRKNHSIKTIDNLKEVLPPPASTKIQKRKAELCNVEPNKKKSISNSTGSSHNDDMKNSLDLALGKVFSKLPTLNSRTNISKPKCIKCDDVEYRNLFKLPCLHVCCRKCIQVILHDVKKCATCDKAFERANVTKLTLI